jgi:Tfp pilus assembly protein PilF
MPTKAQGKDAGPQPNREELLQMGIRAAKSGNKEGARMMLDQVLAQDKRNERAMMWMAKITDSRAERKKWLDRVLEINPDNANAREAIKRMSYQQSARENRTLLIFGVVVGVLIVLAIVIVVALLALR